MASNDLEWKSTEYWKEQSFQTSTRLHTQHWTWQYQLGYALHPEIVSATEGSLRIADVACGTASWLLDVSNTYPQHSYEGFDITATHFPHEQWLPQNVKLNVWDLNTEAPAEFVGQFDVVHIRAFISCIHNNAVDPFLKNLVKLLKPGGFLQWDEMDISTLKRYSPSPDVVSTATDTIVKLLNILGPAQSKLFADWLHDLPITLGNHNGDVMVYGAYAPKPELARAWSDNMLTVWLGLIPSLPDVEMPLPPGMGFPASFSRQSFATWVRETAEEATKGVRVDQEMTVTVARFSG